MTILLCSSDTAITARWRQLISETYETTICNKEAQIPAAILEQEVALVLIHRSMASQEQIAAIQDSTKACKIFVLSDRPDDNEGLIFLKLGAVGYANTFITEPRLNEALRVTLEDKVWVGQKLMQKLIQQTKGAAGRNFASSPPANVSAREWEVAQWIGQGFSNLEIAEKLDIAERTVKSHISALFQKTGTESRLQLALFVKNLSS